VRAQPPEEDAADLAPWDISIMPDGSGLPPGSGTSAQGAVIFAQKCAMCHGGDGSGSTAMGKKLGCRDLRSAAVQGQSDSQLTQIITNGKNKMPAYNGKLSGEEIKSLVAFIRSIKQ